MKSAFPKDYRIDLQTSWNQMNREVSAYHVILEGAGRGWWTAEVPAFGIVTEGKGETGARTAAADAIAGYIAGARLRRFPIPKPDAVVVRSTDVIRASSMQGKSDAPNGRVVRRARSRPAMAGGKKHSR